MKNCLGCLTGDYDTVYIVTRASIRYATLPTYSIVPLKDVKTVKYEGDLEMVARLSPRERGRRRMLDEERSCV